MTGEPTGCWHCGIPQATHARQWTEAAGWHTWARPTDAQTLERMRARRNANQPPEQGETP